jgi:3-dehydroquinate synthase
MKKIKVDLGKRSYPVHIGKGVFGGLAEVVRKTGFTGPVVIVTDRIVKTKTAEITSKNIKKIAAETVEIVVPASERSKCIDVYQSVISRISDKTKKHKPLIIALGGGVVGDLAGFVAASFRRGVPFIQVPTTLLAQVDSSVGGKVGIDLAEAKNLVGAFYQPRCVLADIDFLRTLPPKQIRNGLAEIIKYAIIKDKEFFDILDAGMTKILSLDALLLEKVIARCVAIKARVVEKDEFDDKDVRIILNFGHTLGHAIESASSYSSEYNHGESVAVGMIMASEIAFKLGLFSKKSLDRIKALVSKAGLPLKAKNVSPSRVLKTCEFDKKFTRGSNRFVLPRSIGKVTVVEDIPALLIKDIVRRYVGKQN